MSNYILYQLNELIYLYYLSGRLIPGTRNNLSVREETTMFSYANHNIAGDVLPRRDNDQNHNHPFNSMSTHQQPLVTYNGLPPTTLLPHYSQTSPDTMPPTTYLPFHSETSTHTLPPVNHHQTPVDSRSNNYHEPVSHITKSVDTAALPSPLTNAGAEGCDVFEDDFTCFSGNETSDFLKAFEPEASAMSSNKKEMSMTSNTAKMTSQEGTSFADDKDETSDDIELDEDVLLADMVRYSTVVFN